MDKAIIIIFMTFSDTISRFLAPFMDFLDYMHFHPEAAVTNQVQVEVKRGFIKHFRY